MTECAEDNVRNFSARIFFFEPKIFVVYAVEPNHGELDRITPDGHISRVIDISASQGHIVPTAIAIRDDKFYVGNLNTFPIVPGSSKIFEISKDGHIKIVAEGLTTVLGIAFDNRHRMYVLESMTNPGFPGPGQFGSGKVLRLDHPDRDRDHDRDQTVIAEGLTFPTAMTFGPDGALYVSNVGFGAPPRLARDRSSESKCPGKGLI